MSDVTRVRTALADGEASFEPGRTRLVFRAGFDGGGPGHSEEWVLRVGADTEVRWDVLWLKSDWDEGMMPVAWVAKGARRGKQLAKSLVRAWLEATRDHEEAEGPPFEEVQGMKSAILTRREVGKIVEGVWEAEGG
jgi:hypothetical protein